MPPSYLFSVKYRFRHEIQFVLEFFSLPGFFCSLSSAELKVKSGGEREEVHDDRTERSLYRRVLLGTGCTQVKVKIYLGFRIATWSPKYNILRYGRWYFVHWCEHPGIPALEKECDKLKLFEEMTKRRLTAAQRIGEREGWRIQGDLTGCFTGNGEN